MVSDLPGHLIRLATTGFKSVRVPARVCYYFKSLGCGAMLAWQHGRSEGFPTGIVAETPMCWEEWGLEWRLGGATSCMDLFSRPLQARCRPETILRGASGSWAGSSPTVSSLPTNTMIALEYQCEILDYGIKKMMPQIKYFENIADWFNNLQQSLDRGQILASKSLRIQHLVGAVEGDTDKCSHALTFVPLAYQSSI